MEEDDNDDRLAKLERLENNTKPKTAIQAARQKGQLLASASTSTTTPPVISLPKGRTIKQPTSIANPSNNNSRRGDEDNDMMMMMDIVNESPAATMTPPHLHTEMPPPAQKPSTHVRGINIDEIDFVATSAKDMREIEERTAQNEDNILSTVKLYKKNHISHRHMYRFVDDPLKPCGKQYAEYPKSTDKKCLYCHKQITGIPIFPPHHYDRTKRIFILTRDPHCSVQHAKLNIVFRNRSNSSQQLGLLGWFGREFLGMSFDSITALPLSAAKPYSYYGYLTEEEYEQKQTEFTATAKEPPALFVETFLEEVDIKKREEERRKIFNKMHAIRVTPQQQANYKENIERVVRENQKTNSGIENSPIAQKMNIKMKKSAGKTVEPKMTFGSPKSNNNV